MIWKYLIQVISQKLLFNFRIVKSKDLAFFLFYGKIVYVGITKYLPKVGKK